MRALPAVGLFAASLGILTGCAAGGDAAPSTTTVSGHEHHSMPATPTTPVGGEDDAAAAQAGSELMARLAAAKSGDTLVLTAGRYLGNFVIERGISLIGDGRPILDGGGRGTVLTIDVAAHGATVRGLRLVAS